MLYILASVFICHEYVTGRCYGAGLWTQRSSVRPREGGAVSGEEEGGKGMGKHVMRFFSENMTIRSGYSSKMPRILPENSNYWGRGP